MMFDIPQNNSSIIKVIGVGGGGGNAVAAMYKQGIIGVDFAICNTDAQAMEESPVPVKISLGPHLTEGRGAGSKPSVGKEACIESIDEVRTFLGDNTKMLFVTAGMGGGTGTGAAPIIAKAAREMGVLTVGIVTLPFKFEGMRRHRQALEGLEQLKGNVDSILVISNDKVREMFGNLTLKEAFGEADDILSIAAKGIAEIITVPGYVNVDFEDVNTVMRESGVAIMGSASQSGENRAKKAVEQALSSPLLEDNDIRGAKHILLNITSGTKEVTMDEIGEITDYVQEEAGYGTDLIWGNCQDESLGESISITLIATGFREGATKKKEEEVKKQIVSLDDAGDITGDHSSMATMYTDSQSAHTFDFDSHDVQRTVETIAVQKGRVTNEPYVNEKEVINVEDRNRNAEMEQARREYQRKNTSIPLDGPKIVSDMENTPAYERRNVTLDDVGPTPSHLRVGYTVSVDDEGSVTHTPNSFLHDNVD